jgi:hypothetical protein
MTNSTQTLTQSGLLAVLLQRQRYRAIQLARRRAHRKRVHAALEGYLHWGSARAHCAKAGRPAAPHLNLSPSQFPCLIKYTPTPSSGNRFTRTFGSNIPNGSSQMANVPCVIRTRRA